ncbi:MAG: metal-dependent transcriptional regulator [Cyclobacteriaceae bacterium]
MHSFTEENYLKTLHHLTKHKNQVSVKELSEVLDIKMPTVTSMMKKLAEKGLVKYESYKPLKLTTEGKKAGALIIRKHRLTEMFLVEKMGFGWEEVHEIAEQIEHVKSPAFFAKIDELLGHPKVDPHGSPIPDKEGNMKWIEYSKLGSCKVGDQFTVKAVMNSSEDFLAFLNSRELLLGTRVKIDKVEEFDGSMLVSYGKRTNESLSGKVAEMLLGEKE